MLAHRAALVGQREIPQGGLAAGGVDDDVGDQRLHRRDDVDAPALLRPDREVGVEVRRTRPLHAAVAHLLYARLLAEIALHHELVHLAVGVHKARVHAAGEVIEEHAVDPERLARHLRIGRAVDLPLLKLIAGLLVVDLHGFEECVPVKGLAGRVLDEADHLLELLDGVGLHLVLGIARRHAVYVRGELEIAILERRGHHGAVARHVAADEAGAHLREVVAQRAAGLRRGQGTDVRRDAEVLRRVEIRRDDVLVEDRRQEDRQGLRRETDQIREARHHLAGHELVKEDDLLVLFRVGVQVSVGGERVMQHVGRFLHDPVILEPRHAQLCAAHAERRAVDERGIV